MQGRSTPLASLDVVRFGGRQSLACVGSRPDAVEPSPTAVLSVPFAHRRAGVGG